jgi:hypothetical protein
VKLSVLPLIEPGPDRMLNATASPEVEVAESETGAAPKVTGEAGAVKVIVCDAAIPVPERPRVCGLLAALSVKVSWPVRVPVAVGVKLTITVQVPLAAMGELETQLLVWLKSPEGATAVTVSGPVPVLVRMASEMELEVLMTCGVAKVRVVAGEKPTAGAGAAPVPESCRVIGVLPAAVAPLEEMRRVPVRVPDAVGAKVTLSGQLVPSGSGVAQLVGVTLKSPVVAAVMLVTPVEPKLVVFELRVTVCAAEVWPMVVEAKAVRVEGV